MPTRNRMFALLEGFKGGAAPLYSQEEVGPRENKRNFGVNNVGVRDQLSLGLETNVGVKTNGTWG